MGEEDFSPVLSQIYREFPVLAQHKFQVARGEGPGFAEFFPPWEQLNPQPGASLIQLRQSVPPGELSNLLTGEMLHLVGAINPTTQQPVDPRFRKLRDRFAQTITPEQRSIDLRAYQREGQGRSYEQWMESSRLDAYIRGLMFGQWPKYIFTEPQQRLVTQMQQYLRGLDLP